MYRDFTQRKARTRALKGFVKNLPDGRVEVLAQGERAVLEAFLLLLRRGPLFAQVDGVEVSWRTPQDAYEGFGIAF